MSGKPQEITKTLTTRSERVKMVDMHPKEPLVLCALYSGQVTLWNYDTKSLVKSFEIVDLPVRCCKFITRLQSFACGADDMQVRIFNYNTMEKTKTFQAHDDYIRGLAVHDQLPFILTSSDDMTIKQWDWSKGWAHTMTYEGHSHYVMSIVFNPKDPSTFATASLDQTIKVWSITSPVPNFQLEGHEEGVNCVEYYPGGDKPYLVSGSDDRTVRVWDYQTKACLQVLSHHVHNVTCVFFHPDVPLLFTSGEDETVGVFSTQTWRQEQTLNYGLQRGWTIAAKPGTNSAAIGFDRGMVVVKVGKDEPVMSMDANGKILVAVGNDITRIDVKGIAEKDVADGEVIPLAAKEVGTTESTPTKILHGPSGQYVAVLTDGEYTINSSLAWRPKAFGQAISFTWGLENGAYAILENAHTIKVFKLFKERQVIKLHDAAEVLFGGALLGVRTATSISFYDWETLRVVRRIDEAPKIVEWSDSGELVALVSEGGFFVLKYNRDAVTQHFQQPRADIPEDGLDFAFDLVEEVEEKARQASWVGDCLCFVNSSDRLNYYIGGEVTTIAVLSRSMHLLGFLAKENRIFCIDKDRNVVSYQLFVSVIEYKTAIVREDFDAASDILPRVPESMKYKVAQFLHNRGHLELALAVTTDDDHRFELSILLSRLHEAADIAQRSPSTTRWKQIGDLALELGFFDIAEQALNSAGDFNGLLLLHTSTNDRRAIEELGRTALSKGKANIAFTCFHLVGKHSECADILVRTDKVAEAAFYARTYCHEKVDEVVLRWKNAVAGLPRVRDSIADPLSFPNLFPNIQQAPPPAPPPQAATSPKAETSPKAKETSPPKASPPRAESAALEEQHQTTPLPVPAAAQTGAVKSKQMLEVTPEGPAVSTAAASATTPANTAGASPAVEYATPSYARGITGAADSTVRQPPAPPPSMKKEGDDIDDFFDEVDGGHQSEPRVDPPKFDSPSHPREDDDDWDLEKE